MNTRLRWTVSGVLVAGLISGGGFSVRSMTSRVLAAGPSPTTTPTATVSPTATHSATPTKGSTSATHTATPTKAAGGAKGSATATPTATPTGTTHSAKTTPTATRIVPKRFVKNPTPIPASRKSVTLPAPVVLELGLKQEGKGLTPAKAFALANHYGPQLQISPPSYVPKKWALQLIHVDPSQGAGAPPDMYLQYVPKGLKKAAGTYPSFYITKLIGSAPVIAPGSKVQSVVISKGVHGAGVVIGTVADLKLKNGYEQVHVTWQRLNVSYDVSSAIGLSKLTIKDLLAVAATVS
ncbi:MAG: hypothetical protein ACRDG4_07055 [Chloroflexota bacterium]